MKKMLVLAQMLVCMVAVAAADFDACRPINVISREDGRGTRGAFIELTGLAIAMDGIAVIVNLENPTDELTVEQIGAICTGEVTNWDEI